MIYNSKKPLSLLLTFLKTSFQIIHSSPIHISYSRILNKLDVIYASSGDKKKEDTSYFFNMADKGPFIGFRKGDNIKH